MVDLNVVSKALQERVIEELENFWAMGDGAYVGYLEWALTKVAHIDDRKYYLMHVLVLAIAFAK